MARGRPLRLLFVTADLRMGGAERHIVTLLPALERSRIQASVCCLQGRGPLYDDLREKGVPVQALDLGYGRGSILPTILALQRTIRALRPDVVMTQGMNAGLVGRLASRLGGVDTVIVWKHNVGHLGRHGRTERWVDRALAPITTRYFGVSYGQMTYLVDDLGLAPEKIRVIHNGLDPSGYPPAARDWGLSREFGLPEDAFVIAIVAVLRAEKDHRSAVLAFREVADEMPEARLVIVGDGELRPEIEQLCRRVGVWSRVSFAGSRSDIPHILAGVDAVLLSSVTIENLPFCILEAMAVGRPAVCTAVGGLPELVDDGVTGFLVPPRAPRELADRLLTIARRPDRGRSLGEAARRRLEDRFSLDRAANRVADEVEAAVGSDRRRIGNRPRALEPV